jgi:hypothetical protein
MAMCRALRSETVARLALTVLTEELDQVVQIGRGVSECLPKILFFKVWIISKKPLYDQMADATSFFLWYRLERGSLTRRLAYYDTGMMEPDLAPLGRLWPNREHESNWLKSLLCAVGFHRWHTLKVDGLAFDFCRCCPDIRRHALYPKVERPK